MLATFSAQGVPTDTRTGTRGTIYVALVAAPGVGKTRTIERVFKSLTVRPDAILDINPGSDPGFQHDLTLEPEEGTKKGEAVPQRLNKCLVYLDEMKAVISKLSIQNSALGTMICKLWSSDVYKSSTTKGPLSTLARISILGGVPCADQDEFSTLFTGATMGGLYDRLIVAPQAEPWEWDGNWQHSPAQRHPWPVTIPPSVTTTVDDWMRTTRAAIKAADPDSDHGQLIGRIAENATRVALISASANQESVMTDACIQAALRFAAWQLKVKADFSATSAANDDAIAQAIIIKAFGKLVERDVALYKQFGRGKYYLYGDLARAANLRRHEKTLGPGIFFRCWQAMIGLGTLEREPICGEDGEPKPNQFTKAARLA